MAMYLLLREEWMEYPRGIQFNDSVPQRIEPYPKLAIQKVISKVLILEVGYRTRYQKSYPENQPFFWRLSCNSRHTPAPSANLTCLWRTNSPSVMMYILQGVVHSGRRVSPGPIVCNLATLSTLLNSSNYNFWKNGICISFFLTQSCYLFALSSFAIRTQILCTLSRVTGQPRALSSVVSLSKSQTISSLIESSTRCCSSTKQMLLWALTFPTTTIRAQESRIVRRSGVITCEGQNS